MFLQEIEQIDSAIDKKNIETIYNSKIKNIRSTYKEKLNIK